MVSFIAGDNINYFSVIEILFSLLNLTLHAWTCKSHSLSEKEKKKHDYFYR